MTHYTDLAPCNYFGAQYTGAFRAVGWLVAGRDYPKGHLTPREHEALANLTLNDYPLILTLGRYECELCGQALSTHDLFIPSDSQVLVAPGGILHYAEVHDYLPPERFRRAIVECPPLASVAYFAALLGTDWASVARKELAEQPGISLEAYLEDERRWYIEAFATPPQGVSRLAHETRTRLQHPGTFAVLFILLAGVAILIAFLLVA